MLNRSPCTGSASNRAAMSISIPDSSMHQHVDFQGRKSRPLAAWAAVPEPARLTSVGEFLRSLDRPNLGFRPTADEMATVPVGARSWLIVSEIPARTEFESSTGPCQQDIDRYT